MIQIRSGVFETNSSSTHSICIQKKPVDAEGKSVWFHLNEYGWEEREVDFADYLYTAIMMDDRASVRNTNMKMLKDILDAHHIGYQFERPEFEYFDGSTYLQNGYIDHYDMLGNFVDCVLYNEDMLLRGLFGENSAVYTGNDNDSEDYALCKVAHECKYVKLNDGTWEYKNVGNEDNPYYDPDNFDYFYKGN